jgi:ribosome-binding factor A
MSRGNPWTRQVWPGLVMVRIERVRKQKPNRAQRVAERLKTELMEFLLRGGLREPALESVYVAAVALTDDLRHARVYFRLTQPEVDAKDRNAACSALERASGYLRRELSPRLQLKYMPDFKFFWDDAFDRGARVDAVLAEIEGSTAQEKSDKHEDER